MKRIIVLALVAVLALSAVGTSMAAAPIKMGKADYAAHGTRCFAVAVVALQGDTIVAAYLDEYQMLPKADTIGVPNSLSDFGKAFANEEQVLASKRVNDAYYSNNMATRGGSTVTLANNFIALEQFVIGKTIAELEAILSANDKEAMVDAVTGATVVDAKGYVEALFLAALDALNN